MTEGTDLYRLQNLDSEGDEASRRLAEVEAVLGESEDLDRARQEVDDIQERVKRSSVRQRDLELEVEGLEAKIVREEERLYGGVVKNPKELQDLQAEVAGLKRRRQQLEETLLEVMIEVEETEAARTQAQGHLDVVQVDWSTRQADLLAEQTALKERLAEIEQARESLLPRIDAGDLAIYQALRRRKGGAVVVQLNGAACGGCGVAIPPSLEWQLREGKLVNCANCERIVVRVS